MMTDIWTSASMHAPADVYQEKLEAALDRANTALSPQFAFVTDATTKASFTDRFEIVAHKVEQTVEAATRRDASLFAPVHEALMTQWEQDFDAIVAARQSETQKVGNKRAWFRKQRRAEKVTKRAALYDGDGNWILGDVGGYRVEAVAFSEPSVQYGMAMDPRISKLYVWAADGIPMSRGKLYSFDRGVMEVNDLDGADLRMIVDAIGSFLGGTTVTVTGQRTGKIAMTAAEASHLFDDLDPAVAARLQPFVSYAVYGPEYHRGITENLMDAVRMARGGRLKEYEYILSRLDAHKDIQETGVNNWYYDNTAGKYQQRLDGTMGSTRFQAVASREDPDLNRIRQTAYNDEFWATQNAHADEPHGFVEDTTFAGSHPQDGGRCGICGQPFEYELHTRTANAPTGAAAVASMRKGAPFAGYADFEECVRKNSDKRDPEAYCGSIKHKVEDGKTSALQPLAFEAALSAIKTTNDPDVLVRMLIGNRKRREGADVVLEASLNAQDEIAKVRLEQLGVSASANDDLVDWSEYMDKLERDRKKVNIDGSPNARTEEDELIDWAAWTRAHGTLTRTIGKHALTLVREGGLIHWAVTDDTGDTEQAAGSEPTVRDALEQAWDVLNKVLDKDPAPSDDIVQEVRDAADATSDAVQDAGGTAPEDAAADGGEPIADPGKAPVHPADPQPDQKADPKLEAKPDAPVDDTKTDPSDVKVDPDAKADDPAVKVDPNDPTKTTKDPDAAPPADADKAADPAAKDPAAKDPTAAPAADGQPPAPDDVVDSAENTSMGDVLGIEPTTMDIGQKATMTYTLSDGTVGDTDVTFLREDNGIYFFDGPKGEFGLGDRDGEWVDADGNSFAFSNGDAVEEITGIDDPSNGAQLEDIDLDAPADNAPAKNDPDSKPDFIKDKESAPADDKAPAKDDSKDDGDKDKKAPPWAKSKKSMLAENPWMTDEMATRLAQRSASLAATLTAAVDLDALTEAQYALNRAMGDPNDPDRDPALLKIRDQIFEMRQNLDPNVRD